MGSVQTDTLETTVNKPIAGESVKSVQADTPEVTTNNQKTPDAVIKKMQTTNQEPIKPTPSKYTILTENFPPFNYEEKGELVGISTEIVQEILNRLDMKNVPIKVMDWNEAYQTALEKPNTIIYSLTKIKERKEKFKWAGPIATNYWYLFSKKQPVTEKAEDKIVVKKLDEAKKYKIGVQLQGAIYLYLKSKGFTNLIPSVTNEESAKNLLNDAAKSLNRP